MKQKKVAYLRWLQQKTVEAKEVYQTAKKNARRVIRQAQNEEWVELGKSLQNDFQKNQHRFWNRVRTSGRNREELDKVCAADGQVIGDEHGILERWREYFAGLLQRDTQVTDDGVGDGAGESQEEDGISCEEVAKAIGKLKNRKAPGVCGINAEMLKGGGGIVVRWLCSVIQLMWKRGEVVEDWRRAIIVPLHKKGSKLACSNYRGISLLSIPSKVYAKILDSRLRSRTESMVMEVQGGFKSGRSCVDQIFTIRQLSEKILEKNKQMIIACVDLEKAYDKVCRENLWRMLVRYKLGGHLLRAIQSFYRASKACVRVNGKLSRWFPIYQGVRQGCVMSPWLFNIYIDGIIREAMDDFVGGVQLSNTKVQVLLFADDIVMVTERKEDIQRNLEVLKAAMDKWEMKMHLGKTKVMVVSRVEEGCSVTIDGEKIEEVQSLKYLGSSISADGSSEEDIEQRIGAATRVVGAMRKEVLERRELKKETKLRVFNAMAVPTLLYGCETWTVQKRHESRLQACEMMWCLRRIEGVSRLDRMRNEDIRQSLGQVAVVDMMKDRQMRWKEKLERMDGSRLVKQVYEGDVVGKRPRGRPRKRWDDNFK